jgi:hypothetical protein
MTVREKGKLYCSILLKYFNQQTFKIRVIYNDTSPSIYGKQTCYFSLKNAVLWDVKNRRFGGTYRLHHQDDKNQRARKNVTSN